MTKIKRAAPLWLIQSYPRSKMAILGWSIQIKHFETKTSKTRSPWPKTKLMITPRLTLLFLGLLVWCAICLRIWSFVRIPEIQELFSAVKQIITNGHVPSFRGTTSLRSQTRRPGSESVMDALNNRECNRMDCCRECEPVLACSMDPNAFG